MTALSSAGWIVHDVGLAASIGGGLFGQLAMEPSLKEVHDPEERDRLSAKAWNKYSWIDLAGHLAFAVPWLIGRKMLTGSEVSAPARALTLAKDVLVGVSLISGVASIVIGRRLSERSLQGQGPDRQRAVGSRESPMLEKSVSITGMINTLSTIGVLGVTSLLAMAGNKSMRFKRSAKRLP